MPSPPGPQARHHEHHMLWQPWLVQVGAKPLAGAAWGRAPEQGIAMLSSYQSPESSELLGITSSDQGNVRPPSSPLSHQPAPSLEDTAQCQLTQG